MREAGDNPIPFGTPFAQWHLLALALAAGLAHDARA
jgi:hypothetical protein